MATQTSKATTMEELLAYASGVKGFKKFDHVKARFISMDKKQALFDIGGKSEAVVIDDYYREAKELLKALSPKDEVEAIVMEPETKDGKILLSLRHAAHKKMWEELTQMFDKGEPVLVLGQMVTDKGIGVSIGGLAAFIPTTQLTQEQASHMDELVGKRFKVQIIELDSTKNRVVLSEKAIYEAQDQKKLKDILKDVKPGEKYTGIVTTVTSFGAFVQIEINGTPLEGLVHVSEFSWGKTVHPSDMLTEGDEISVVVIGTENGKLALSMKQAQADPWDSISEKYHVDDKVTGTVTKHSDFGVFVELEAGIEGLIHMTKIPPAMKLNRGDSVNCYIEEISPKDRRISLGLVITTSKPLGYK